MKIEQFLQHNTNLLFNQIQEIETFLREKFFIDEAALTEDFAFESMQEEKIDKLEEKVEKLGEEKENLEEEKEKLEEAREYDKEKIAELEKEIENLWKEKEEKKEEKAITQEKIFAGVVEIVTYSEKAIAVFGDTKPMKEKLKALGGRFNPFLTNNGGKMAGWIFPKTKSEELSLILNS